MYLLFFLLWIIFNGKVTLEICIFGLVIAAVMYAFLCKFMDFSLQKELKLVKKTGYVIAFLYHLVGEITKANIATMRLLLSSNYEEEPVIIHFKTNLKNDMSKCMLANAITLTPGTITVETKGDEFTVHCLDRDFAEGIEKSVFVTLLEKIEG